jgi:hypothetical protein
VYFDDESLQLISESEAARKESTCESWPRVHIPCKLYAGDTPTLTIDSIVICQTPRQRSPNFCARNAPWLMA